MTTTFLQNSALIALRLGLFTATRKYLTRSLYPDLASLSLEESPSTSQTAWHAHLDSTEANIELEMLPSPATTSVEGPSRRRAPTGPKFHHSSVSQAMFSVVLTESFTMFLLLIFQAVEVFDPNIRLYHWWFSLTFLIVSIVAIIPQCTSLLLMVAMQSGQNSGRIKLRGIRVAISFIPVMLLLLAIMHIPLPEGLASHDVMTGALSRLIILGTIILGLLSGFGAISNSWGFIPFLSSSTLVPTEQQLSSTEHSLTAIRNDLEDRLAAAARDTEPTVDRSWLSHVSTSLRPKNELEQEIQGLQALEQTMARKLESLRETRDAAKFSSSWKGKLYKMIGYLFAIYCVVRVISSSVNILLPSRRFASSETTYPDIASELLVYILSWIYRNERIQLEDVIPVARQLSLIFVGIMILTSVRRVLRGVTRVLRVTSRNLGASLMLLILAQLMGIYLLSTIVQMRSSFPPPTKRSNGDAGVRNLFSTIPPYEVFGSLFDWSFLFSAAVSFVVRWGTQKVNNAGDP